MINLLFLALCCCKAHSPDCADEGNNDFASICPYIEEYIYEDNIRNYMATTQGSNQIQTPYTIRLYEYKYPTIPIQNAIIMIRDVSSE